MSDLFDFNDTTAVDNQSQSLSNKLRPERMKDLIGQDHITSKAGPLTVSYTHLTLPTIYSV